MQNSKMLFQNGNSPNNRRNHPDNQTQDHLQSITPNNNNNNIQSTIWPNVLGNGDHTFSGSISQARSSGYENTSIDGSMFNNNDIGGYGKIIDPTKDTYGTIQLNGTRINGQQNKHSRNYGNSTMNGNVSLYENVVINSVQNNNQNNHSMPKKNGQLSNSCEMIENKLAISNDDLLEAIEQLSMLSKSKEICTIPKKNNTEKDNAKSNEAKAEKERKELEEEDRKKYIEFLQNEKLHILGNMDILKRSVADIEIQEEEISREVGVI